MKSYFILLADGCEKFIKIPTKKYVIDPLFCVFVCSYTYQCRIKCTGINLKTLQEKDMISLIESNIHGGVGDVMGDRYVKSDENEKFVYRCY